MDIYCKTAKKKTHWMHTSKKISFNIRQKKQKQNQNALNVWLIERFLTK